MTMREQTSNGTARGRLSVTTFCALQVVFVSAVVAYGAYRYQELTIDKSLPAPDNEPLQVGPLYDRPEVVSDEQLVAVLQRLKPRLRGTKPPINNVDHALRCWGIPAEFDDPECLSGVEMRELLLDHRAFREAWGSETKPFLVPNTGADTDLIAFRTKSGKATASHYDHTIAGLAEVGTPLDYPVISPIGERPLRAALEHALREFSLNQEEYEWSTLAFLHYLSRTPGWYSTEGQEITWDRLAERLMRQRLALGVCYGNHRLHTLVMLLRVDAEHGRILSDEMRGRIVAHLQDATARLVQTQHPDGWWDGRWPGDEWDGPQTGNVDGPFGIDADRLLATGHALEWWALAPPEVLPPDETLTRSGQWLCRSIEGLSDGELKSYYPFLTHAGRALALWRGKFPHQVMLPPTSSTPTPLETAVAPAVEPAAAPTEGGP